MVPGGRVELPTPAFSGPRSTGELPRHRGDKHSTGAARNSQNGAAFANKRTGLRARSRRALAAVRLELANPIFAFQDFARLRAVGGADDAVFFHHVDQSRRAAVPDAQTALQSGSGSAAHFTAHFDGFLIESVVDLFAAAFAA